MKLDLGDCLSARKKVTALTVRLYDTVGGIYGRDETNTYSIPYKSGEVFTDDTLFTGYVHIPFEGWYDRSGRIVIQQQEPYPMTVLSITAELGAH